MYNGILVPTDGSESSTAAVNHALEIAAPHSATIHFLYVVDVDVEASASGHIVSDLTETLEQDAEDALDAATTQAEEMDVTYEENIVEGVPHEAIAEYSSDQDLDLIVMGSSGRSGLKDHLLGSTTDRVIRSVDVSVLIVRP